MKHINMILYAFYALLVANFICLTNCVPNSETVKTEDEPPIKPELETEITFDIDHINENEVIIKKGVNNNTKEMLNFFQFVPKAGVSIGSVVLHESKVWKRLEGTRVESVTVVKNGFVHLFYAIKVRDKSGASHLINFMFPTMMFSDVGLAEYLERLHCWNRNQATVFNKCNMLSAFDYNYADKTVRLSADGGLKTITIEPTNHRHFDQIWDGPNVVHSAERIKSIEIASKLGTRCLMKLETADRHFIYFKFAESWLRIHKLEYHQLFEQHGFAECTIRAKEQSGHVPSKFNIADAGRYLMECKDVYLSVPAISYVFTYLSQVWDGPQLIFDKPLRNGTIILYKGAFSHEMIEILHNSGPEYATLMDFSFDVLRKRGLNLRKFNLYFVRTADKWRRCSQAEFVARFIAVAVANLEEFGAEMRLQLGRQLSPGGEGARVLERLEANASLLEFLRSLSLEDSAVGPTAECGLAEFFRYEFLKPFQDEPASPQPLMAIGYHLGPLPESSRSAGPETLAAPSHHVPPEQEPDKPYPIYSFGGSATTSPEGGLEGSDPPATGLTLTRLIRLRRLILGMMHRDNFCTSSLLLSSAFLFTAF